MTTSDGDDPAARGDRSDEDDRDPARLSPPADPWLTEAPTSAFGEAGAVPPADTARFDAASAVDGPPLGWADPPRPQRRTGRRATRWIVAVLAVCALFIAGMLATDFFGSGGDNDARTPGPSIGASPATAPVVTRTGARQQPPAGDTPAGGQPATADTPATTAGGRPDSSGSAPAPGAGGPVVVYEVTASGSRNTGSVSYTDQDGDIIRLNGIALPWRTTFPVDGRRKPLVLIAQRKGGGDAGPVTCTITFDGKLLSSTTADGRYAAPQCSG